ncbi:MAG: hypothetical protein ACREJX_14870, partial [Polyangiaceae bacterium]
MASLATYLLALGYYSSPSSSPWLEVGAPPSIDGTPAGGEALGPEAFPRPPDERLAAAFLAGFFALFLPLDRRWPAFALAFLAERLAFFFLAVLPADFFVVFVFFAPFFAVFFAAIMYPSLEG